jgi:hypothetical protein
MQRFGLEPRQPHIVGMLLARCMRKLRGGGVLLRRDLRLDEIGRDDRIVRLLHV